jgi:hypothetical protein
MSTHRGAGYLFFNSRSDVTNRLALTCCGGSACAQATRASSGKEGERHLSELLRTTRQCKEGSCTGSGEFGPGAGHGEAGTLVQVLHATLQPHNIYITLNEVLNANAHNMNEQRANNNNNNNNQQQQQPTTTTTNNNNNNQQQQQQQQQPPDVDRTRRLLIES